MTYQLLKNTYVAAGYTLAAAYNGLVVDHTAGVGGNGVYSGHSAIIENYGVIHGIYLNAGGTVKNGFFAYPAEITAPILINNGSGVVTNLATIVGSDFYSMVGLYDGGSVTNGSASNTTAIIAGGGVVIGGAASGSVTNYGTIRAGKYKEHAGVELVGGGGVKNIGGHALIEGSYGVDLVKAGYTVVNQGTVIGDESSGVVLDAGGSLTNGSTAFTGALVRGAYGGIWAGGAATVSNFGTIEGTGSGTIGYGIKLAAGGVVRNGSQSDAGALVQGYTGITIAGAGTVDNYGIVKGEASWGVVIDAGGSVRNGSGTDRGATIEGVQGVHIAGASGTVANFGTILGEATSSGGSGVALLASGTLNNGSASDATALIEGYDGAAVFGTSRVANYGTMRGDGAASLSAGLVMGFGLATNGSRTDTAARLEGYAGFDAFAMATLFNYGTVAGDYRPGAIFSAGGRVINGIMADHLVVITGVTGVDITGAANVANYGTVNGATGYGVVERNGGTMTNGAATDTTALIEGAIGIEEKGACTVVNLGTVLGAGGSGQYAIYLEAGGRLTNGDVRHGRSLIEGYGGLRLQGGAAGTNFGSIIGDGSTSAGVNLGSGSRLTNGGAAAPIALIEGYVGLTATGPGTIDNFGTIEGLGGVAVQFNSASDVLVVEAGSSFQGSIVGGGGTLVLGGGAGTLAGLFSAPGVTVSGSIAPTTFQAFNTVQVAAGASFTAAGPINIAAADKLIDAGTLTVSGTISNSGQVLVSGGDLIVAAAGAVLIGTGTVQLSGAAQISGATAGSTLTNVSDLILGAGQLGAGQMTLVNQAKGVIRNLGNLTIDTGAATITNAGFIEANTGGGVEIKSAVANTGQLRAQGGTLTVDGVVTGAGLGVVQGGTLKIAATATFNENVSFITAGTLELAHGQTYAGTISGFSKSGGTFLDLDDVNSAGATATWLKSTGNLTVTDGTHTAVIHLAGDYTGSTFVVADDGHGHALVHDPNLRGAEQTVTVPKVHPFIAAAAGFGASATAPPLQGTDAWRAPAAALGTPRVQTA